MQDGIYIVLREGEPVMAAVSRREAAALAAALGVGFDVMSVPAVCLLEGVGGDE